MKAVKIHHNKPARLIFNRIQVLELLINKTIKFPHMPKLIYNFHVFDSYYSNGLAEIFQGNGFREG